MRIAKTEKRIYWGIVLGVVALAIGLLWVVNLYTDSKSEKLREESLNNMTLKEVSFNGKTHEYVCVDNVMHNNRHSISIAHWEDCKYCKNHK